ncbi:hypothetical protein [Nakamurella sp. PAMC28650]|uniref:hypothetical protein n=1 Tax=Nakamurella sp. PAMC28650 TaxID=2762325 RepID=UPI00164DEF04|nr:hypothetical protein [Nakamurella sp. PAMC28650]QNK80063.1 hypothetical protein H7F38_17795 [Nakamurella sp. PAMC28650]
MKELDDRFVITAGGWDPRYAVTLAVAWHQGVGAALIDTNGDEADVDLDLYDLDADGVWQAGSSVGVGESGGFLSNRIAVCSGRTEPGSVVDIEYSGQCHSVRASATGWWLFVTVAAPNSDAFPTVVRTRPGTL